MLTKKGKYGLKALVHLSKMPPGELAFVGDIAAKNNIPKKFLDAILGELRNAGFVQSRKGKEGGYRLAKLPAKSRLAMSCVSSTGRSRLSPAPAAASTSAARTATRRPVRSAT